jgi:hypothetical protein
MGCGAARASRVWASPCARRQSPDRRFSICPGLGVIDNESQALFSPLRPLGLTNRFVRRVMLRANTIMETTIEVPASVAESPGDMPKRASEAPLVDECALVSLSRGKVADTRPAAGRMPTGIDDRGVVEIQSAPSGRKQSEGRPSPRIWAPRVLFGFPCGAVTPPRRWINQEEGYGGCATKGPRLIQWSATLYMGRIIRAFRVRPFSQGSTEKRNNMRAAPLRGLPRLAENLTPSLPAIAPPRWRRASSTPACLICQ